MQNAAIYSQELQLLRHQEAKKAEEAKGTDREREIWHQMISGASMEALLPSPSPSPTATARQDLIPAISDPLSHQMQLNRKHEDDYQAAEQLLSGEIKTWIKNNAEMDRVIREVSPMKKSRGASSSGPFRRGTDFLVAPPANVLPRYPPKVGDGTRHGRRAEPELGEPLTAEHPRVPRYSGRKTRIPSRHATPHDPTSDCRNATKA